MKLAKSSISIAALAALLGSSGLRSDVEAGVIPDYVQLSNAGPVSCNGPPGGTCTITPAVSYNVGYLPPGVGVGCCDPKDNCHFFSDADGGESVVAVTNGSMFSGAAPFTFNTSNTPGQALRYWMEFAAHCRLIPSNLLRPLINIDTQTLEITYIVTNGG